MTSTLFNQLYQKDQMGLSITTDYVKSIGDPSPYLKRIAIENTGNQHQPVFMGTVEWPRLAKLIAESAYTKCVSMEASIHNSGIEREDDFLSHVFKGGVTFSNMIDGVKSEQARGNKGERST